MAVDNIFQAVEHPCPPAPSEMRACLWRGSVEETRLDSPVNSSHGNNSCLLAECSNKVVGGVVFPTTTAIAQKGPESWKESSFPGQSCDESQLTLDVICSIHTVSFHECPSGYFVSNCTSLCFARRDDPFMILDTQICEGALSSSVGRRSVCAR